MKVIAIVPGAYQREEKLIVEMTPSELNKIHAGSTIRPDIGMTVEVGQIYNRLKGLNANQGKLREARQQLIAVAGLARTT
jgi:hypothetical protein